MIVMRKPRLGIVYFCRLELRRFTNPIGSLVQFMAIRTEHSRYVVFSDPENEAQELLELAQINNN